MFVYPISRASREGARAEASHASHRRELPTNGVFEFRLAAQDYVHGASVTIVGGGGDTALFRGVVPIGENVTITVPSADSEDLQPLEGTIELLDGPATKADLLLLEAATNEPVTYQWGLSGRVLPVFLSVKKRFWTSLAGPVTLLIDDADGLHLQMHFDSVGELRRVLKGGLKVNPIHASWRFATLGGHEVEYVEVAASLNERFVKRRQCRGQGLRMRLNQGVLTVHGYNDAAGAKGLARVAASPGDRTVSWLHVTPGPASHHLAVITTSGDPIRQARCIYRLDRSSQPGAVSGLFHWTGESGPDGTVYAAGLLPGRYSVRVSHDTYATQYVTCDVPGPSVKVTMEQSPHIVWLPSIEGAPIRGSYRVAWRRVGDSSWDVETFGADSWSGECVQRGLAPGPHEFVVYNSNHVAKVEMDLEAEGQPRTMQIVLQPATMARFRVVDGEAQPWRKGYVELRGPSMGGKAWLTVWPGAAEECAVPILPVAGLGISFVDPVRGVLAEFPVPPPTTMVVQ